MEVKTHKLYYGGNLMPWGKGTVVNPNGWIFLGGAEGIVPDSTKTQSLGTETSAPVDVAKGVEAQARLYFEKIKSALAFPISR